MDWFLVYEFSKAEERIRAMQAATLGATDFGVSAKPALVGSSEWWQAIERGELPRYVVEGTISRVYWGSMGDWPEFELAADDEAKSKSTWTREGEIARYVEGLRVRVTYTVHPWKVPNWSRAEDAKIVLRVEVEASDRRSDPCPPGPGGIGRR